MSKTGPELRHEAKQRMEKYRLEMISKGFFSTTIFLSQEHRAELKRLGEEHRLTRAEAAEHIFKVYLESENKDITQTHNTNMDHQTETIAIIEDMKDRLKVLEEKWSKQAEIIENPVSAVEGVHLQNAAGDKDATQTHSTNIEAQVKTPVTPDIEPTDKQISETQAEMFDAVDAVQEPVEPKPEKDTELPDYLIDVKPDMPIEERHKIILQLAEDFPGRGEGSIGNTQKRIDMLNAASILLNGKPWKTTKQFADQLSIARRWAKKS